MKYIKTYENIDSEPKIGDYVICIDKGQDDEEFIDFLSNNIGKIVSIGIKLYISYDYVVQYEYIPEEIAYYFHTYNKNKNSRPMNINEIIEFSENKKDLEMYIDAKKYNL